ncbi:MAG TPA: DnaJ domain-containing protein [Sulfurovum sp.]|jgi:DnaJ-class molecular chaperone|nr:MAG: heat-shock protein [Sulfurovum sp. 35-42-20]OYY55499.1 MAG: heat-shock protein [Sulfurovum sp. 28-43-6]OYZ25478.1 MAG: heat-shock protein [Sulfurovum sp. 16-42-52]OYZ48258.1 MAG: heat-shock protein [Sulfurovum sp. 24-42-9]OZA59334.1 MAG: heat-shock protein [Sulfurovum sp. 39-42-12]HQR73587.1 DnaJ domain-containing protein [Sulfurovum sp.]
MMIHPAEEIEKALEILNLPKLISKADIKKQFRFMAKKNHPDVGGDPQKMEELNHAYKILMKYIEEFRYTFDAQEISKQFPGANHAQQFKP